MQAQELILHTLSLKLFSAMRTQDYVLGRGGGWTKAVWASTRLRLSSTCLEVVSPLNDRK